MRTREPEEIEKEIKKLQIELVNSKLERQKILIWSDSNHDFEDRIGFFDLKKARIILTELVAGKKLLLEHQAFGTFSVYMNPQKNSILVYKKIKDKWEQSFRSSDTDISSDNILSFVVWAAGDWFIYNEE